MTKYTIKHTSQFKKDYKLAKKRNLDLGLLKEVVSKLADGIPLEDKYRDHPLSSNWIGYRECHIFSEAFRNYDRAYDTYIRNSINKKHTLGLVN